MAITILQKPGDIQSAQSPIVFTVLESTQTTQLVLRTRTMRRHIILESLLEPM